MAYYKANKQTSKIIAQWHAERIAKRREWSEYGKRVGGVLLHKLLISPGIGVDRLAGICFETPPDRELWKPVKGFHGYYEPKRTKKSAAIRKEFDDAKCDFHDRLAKLVGFELFYNLAIYRAGYFVLDGDVYLDLPDHARGDGCRRITDVLYRKKADSLKAHGGDEVDA
jgi:hypothetical protein